MNKKSWVNTHYSYTLLRSSETLQFKELLKVFSVAFEDFETYQAAIPSERYLQSLLENPYIHVLVARHDQEVVGGLVAYELQKFEQERSEIYIYDLAVSTPHRRKGVATGLIKRLKDEGRKRGAHVMYVQADKGDAPAMKLYQSLGRCEEVYHFDIPIE